jgi:acyl-coenzyme A synthetase/AMP-(fatty) acid ligase
MDVNGNEAAKGEPGEIWIKGPTVFKGYLNNPVATSDAVTSDGYFQTGDIGLEDINGNLFITDRIKELIKYKGSQVAPAELEGILASHPKVKDVAVVGVFVDAIASEVPLGYVVPVHGVVTDEKTATEIVAWLATRVGQTKQLRGGIVWTEEIPKSASGKILRRILKANVNNVKAMGASELWTSDNPSRL